MSAVRDVLVLSSTVGVVCCRAYLDDILGDLEAKLVDEEGGDEAVAARL
jgi:hypothetical protein